MQKLHTDARPEENMANWWPIHMKVKEEVELSLRSSRCSMQSAYTKLFSNVQQTKTVIFLSSHNIRNLPMTHLHNIKKALKTVILEATKVQFLSSS